MIICTKIYNKLSKVISTIKEEIEWKKDPNKKMVEFIKSNPEFQKMLFEAALKCDIHHNTKDTL